MTEPRQAKIRVEGRSGIFLIALVCAPWWVGAFVITKATITAIF
jgi:hypothetical protein